MPFKTPQEITDAGIDMHNWDDEHGEPCPLSRTKGPLHRHGTKCIKCGAVRDFDSFDSCLVPCTYAESEGGPFSYAIPPCGEEVPPSSKGVIETVRICRWCYMVVAGDVCETGQKGCREMGIAEVKFYRKLTPEEKAE